MKTDIFRAIADPTRREIITLVAQKPLNVNAIADNFKVTRQAVSLHVNILVDCGLIKIKTRGRERFCEAKLDRLEEVTNWVAESKKIWESRFGKLEKFLDEIQDKEK